MKPVLLDTAPLVAFLDKADPYHAQVRESLPGLSKGRAMVTTAAVITEMMFFLQRIPHGPKQAAVLLESAHIRILNVFTTPHLKACAQLMTQYADTPMDFADASLVLLAASLDTSDILTLDERGFRTYRFLHKRPFHLLLQDGPSPS